MSDLERRAEELTTADFPFEISLSPEDRQKVMRWKNKHDARIEQLLSENRQVRAESEKWHRRADKQRSRAFQAERSLSGPEARVLQLEAHVDEIERTLIVASNDNASIRQDLDRAVKNGLHGFEIRDRTIVSQRKDLDRISAEREAYRDVVRRILVLVHQEPDGYLAFSDAYPSAINETLQAARILAENDR